MGTTALVAGGAGFLGSHLCDHLLARGYAVVALDNFITGRRSNVAHLDHEPRFQLVEADAAVALTVDGHFDCVFHFASPASPPRYMAHPIETLHAGSVATEALLEVARRDGARFVLASTSEVYGDPLVHPQPESYWGNVNSTGPRSVYDEAKRYAEAITFAYHRHFGTNTSVVRIFNTYGPRMDPLDGRAVPAFIHAALRDAPLPLHGDGSQTRSLCYVDDLIRGILAVAESDMAGPVNVGNPHEQSLKEIAELIIDLADSSSTIEYQPRPVDDPQRRRPDLSLIAERLGWQPKVDARDGLARTVKWYSEHLSGAGDIQ